MKPERAIPTKNQRIDRGTVSRHRRDRNNLRNFSENPASFYTSAVSSSSYEEFIIDISRDCKKLVSEWTDALISATFFNT